MYRGRLYFYLGLVICSLTTTMFHKLIYSTQPDIHSSAITALRIIEFNAGNLSKIR